MHCVSWRNIIRLLGLCVLFSTVMGTAQVGASSIPQGGDRPIGFESVKTDPATTEGVIPGCGADDTWGAEMDTEFVLAAPGVLANDNRGTGRPNRSVVVTTTTHGTLSLDLTGGFSYTPDSGFVGTDSFVYTMNCYPIEGAITTGFATVTLKVQAPITCSVGDDSYSMPENTTLSIAAPGVVANDTLEDPRYTLTVGSPSHGSVTMSRNGSFDYVPDAGFTGIDTFTYNIGCYICVFPNCPTSLSGPVVRTATVTITVFSTSCTAIDDAFSMGQDTVLTVAAPGILANDIGITPSVNYLGTSPAHGTISQASDGSFTYTPTAGYAGIDRYTYVIGCAGGSDSVGTVTIEVKSTTPPTACVAADDSYSTAMDTSLTVAAPGVLNNDMGTNASVSFVGTSPAHGSVTQAADGSLIYTPETGFVGSDSYTYVINCTGGSDSLGTVTISVMAPVPSVPDATPLPQD